MSSKCRRMPSTLPRSGAVEFGRRRRKEPAAIWEQSVCSTMFAREAKKTRPRRAAAVLWSLLGGTGGSSRKIYKQTICAGEFSSRHKRRAHLWDWMVVRPRPRPSLLSEAGDVLCKAYQLSQGNPIQDTKVLLESLRQQVESQEAHLEVLGVGTTGYAKDILHDALYADVALVETVAHTTIRPALLCTDPHCIVDVGGQDIKIIDLHDGRIKDFRLNTQCSAGNGYFLQSTAQDFGVRSRSLPSVAFTAETMPVFGYGCAVFLQSDIVNFQRRVGARKKSWPAWRLCFRRISSSMWPTCPTWPSLGTRFVLQGGTQNNLAVVKAEVDFIRGISDAGAKPEIFVHPHCGEAGAIGAALEACGCGNTDGALLSSDWTPCVRLSTGLRGTKKRAAISARTTVCGRFWMFGLASGDVEPSIARNKVPLEPGEQRMIIATCEKGGVEDLEQHA